MAGIFANIDSDIRKLQRLKQEIENVKEALKSINVKVDIDIAKGMEAQLKSLMRQYDALVNKVSEAEGKIMLSTRRINDTSEKIIKAQEQLSKAAGMNPQSGSGNVNTAANNAGTASVQAQAKAYDELKQIINETSGSLLKNVNAQYEVNHAIGLYSKELKEIEKTRKSRGKDAEYTIAESARIKQLTLAIEQLKIARSDASREVRTQIKIHNAATGSLNELRQELIRMKDAYADMSAEMRNSSKGANLIASIQQAHKEISEIEQSMGVFSRNVGNYASGFNGLNMSVQQIVRELPSAAMGLNTFFLAISNNIPVLADEIKRAKAANEELKASGKKGIPIWKQVASSLFSWQSALIVGITLLTTHGDKVGEWITSLFKAKDGIAPLSAATSELNKYIAENNNGYGNSIATLNKLQSKWKELDGDLSKQKTFIYENRDAFSELGVSINDVNDAEKILSSGTDQFIKTLDLRAKAAAAYQLAIKKAEEAFQHGIAADEILQGGANIWDYWNASVDVLGNLDWAIQGGNVFNPGKYTEGRAGKELMASDKAKSTFDILMKLSEKFSKEREERLKGLGVTDNEQAKLDAEQARLKAIAREKLKREADEQRKQQERLSEELLSLRRKNQQDEINLMEDGTEKKVAQIDLDYQKELDAIESAREKAKKDGIYGQQSPLLDEAEENAFKRYQQAVTETHKQEAEAQAEAMRNYLKEYGTFQQQKLAIAEEYAEKIRKAQSEGERLSLEKERDSALLDIDVKAAQQNIDWQSVFGDLGTMLREQIQPTIDNLKKITQSDEFKNSSVEEKQRIYDILSELEKQSGTFGKDMFKDVARDLELYRNSLNAYNNAQKREIEATIALVKAKENLKKAQENGGDVKSAQQAVDEAQTLFNQASESVKTLGEKASENAETLKTSSEKVRGALEGLAGGLNKLKSGSLSQAFDGIKDIGERLGGKIGDAIANIDPTGIISGVLSILDVLKDGFSSIFVSLQDTLFGAIEGILDDVLSGDIIVKPIQNAFSHIGNILDTVTFGGFNSWFGVGGNRKEVEEAINRLTDRNETLQSAIEDLTDEMKASKGIQSVAAYRDAYKYQKETNDNYKRIAQEQARYSGSHHSWNYYWSGFSQEQIDRLSGKIGRDWNGDIWNLTPEEMKMLRETVDMWETIQNTGKGGYGDRLTDKLNDYIEQAGKLDELTDNLYEGLTGMSFDSMYDSFVSSLMDMEKSAKDVADDVSKYFMQAMLSNAIGEQFSDKLRAWYDRFGNSMENDGTLDSDEMDKLLNGDGDFMGWNEMVDEAMKLRDELAAATGYDKISQESTSQSASSKGFQTMSQDTGEELNGRFTALQIAGEEIKNQSIIQSQSLNLLTVKADALLSINEGTRNIADDTRDLIAQSYLELVQISENTGNSAKYLKEIKADIAEVKRNTSKL